MADPQENNNPLDTPTPDQSTPIQYTPIQEEDEQPEPINPSAPIASQPDNPTPPKTTTPDQSPPTPDTPTPHQQQPPQPTEHKNTQPMIKKDDPTPLNLTNTPSLTPKPSKALPLILSILLLISLVIAGYLFLENQQLRSTLSVVPSPTPSPTTTPTPSPSPDPYENWQSYTDPIHSLTFMYPPEYEISGELAESQETWKAGEGIIITNSNNPSNPSIVIEAVFDGYGPIFPSGTISAELVNNKISANLIKYSDLEYEDYVNNGYIQEGYDLYTSNILQHNEIPFWFIVSHQDRGNTELDNELMNIINTIEFRLDNN